MRRILLLAHDIRGSTSMVMGEIREINQETTTTATTAVGFSAS